MGIDILCINIILTLENFPEGPVGGKSTLVHVMAWYCRKQGITWASFGRNPRRHMVSKRPYDLVINKTVVGPVIDFKIV